MSCCSLAWSARLLITLILLGDPTGAERPPADAAETPSASVPAAAAPAVPTQGDEPGTRLREGEFLLNRAGTFQYTGDRILFAAHDQAGAWPVLENLALERVARLLAQHADSVWTVTGTLTEFHGRNYLLLDRAVIRAPARMQADPSPPLGAVDTSRRR
jgi:hypothetical protein